MDLFYCSDPMPEPMSGTCRVMCADRENEPWRVCGLPGVVLVNVIPGPLASVEEDFYCLKHYRWVYCCAECGEPKESVEHYVCSRCDWMHATWPPRIGGEPIA
jgi:hypothetical protein